jgi:hypothetical protein
MKRYLLTDEIVEARLQQYEKLHYLLSLTGCFGGAVQAEIVGPLDSPHRGRAAFGSNRDRAVANLVSQLARQGFVGRLVEGPIR